MVPADHHRAEPADTCDVLGIGFGPSNLALAIALHEHNAQHPNRALSSMFHERQPSFGWHRGMLIDGPWMQVPFVKDLVTLRNPCSRFSFVSYLHSEGRLSSFINRRSWFPSRLEFNDYLLWAAAAFDDVVTYGSEVVAVSPVWCGDRVVAFDVHVHAQTIDDVRCHRARNLVIAVGSKPWVPAGVVVGERIWHSSELAHKMSEIARSREPPARVIVAGAGQSAAETVEYLHRRLIGTEICALFADLGFRPLDDSPYTNTIFDPARVDMHFDAPAPLKQQLLDDYRNAVDSVVDRELIQTLYARSYEESVIGAPRLRIVELARILRAEQILDHVEIEIESRARDTIDSLTADMLVLATGYRQLDPADLLGDVLTRRLTGTCERLVVERDYRLRTTPEVTAAIYVQGPTEHTHGASSGVLSNLACRAGEIARSIARSHEAPAPARARQTWTRAGHVKGGTDADHKRERSQARAHR